MNLLCSSITYCTDQERLFSWLSDIIHGLRHSMDLQRVTNRCTCSVNLEISRESGIKISSTAIGTPDDILLALQVGVGDTNSRSFSVAIIIIIVNNYFC